MSETIWVAIITLIASAGTSSITQIIINRHDRKMKTIDLQSTIKKEAIDNFIDCTLDSDLFSMNNAEFYKSLNKLILYLDKTSLKYVNKIQKMVEDGVDTKQINQELLKLTTYLSEKDDINFLK